jgi:hypothetical protein
VGRHSSHEYINILLHGRVAEHGTLQHVQMLLWRSTLCAQLHASTSLSPLLCHVQVVIDVLKHSVLGKFNDMRPGIYREYMKVRHADKNISDMLATISDHLLLMPAACVPSAICFCILCNLHRMSMS